MYADPLAEKYPGIGGYVYCAGNPVNAIDPDGREVFMLFYITGNGRGDEMFYAAALTRQRDIMNSSSFNPKKDIIVMSSVSDLSSISGKVSSITQQYSEKYGPTAEFNLNEQNVALPMRTSVNGTGTVTNTNYQNGATR